jgi:hypothetical protein
MTHLFLVSSRIELVALWRYSPSEVLLTSFDFHLPRVNCFHTLLRLILNSYLHLFRYSYFRLSAERAWLFFRRPYAMSVFMFCLRFGWNLIQVTRYTPFSYRVSHIRGCISVSWALVSYTSEVSKLLYITPPFTCFMNFTPPPSE